VFLGYQLFLPAGTDKHGPFLNHNRHGHNTPYSTDEKELLGDIQSFLEDQ
jgi:hypothetical protein